MCSYTWTWHCKHPWTKPLLPQTTHKYVWQGKLCWQDDGCSAANQVVNDFWKVNVLRCEKMTHSDVYINVILNRCQALPAQKHSLAV